MHSKEGSATRFVATIPLGKPKLCVTISVTTKLRSVACVVLGGAVGSLTLAAIVFAVVFAGGAVGLELQRRMG
jgi:ABC-type microcin C transport system permease subunit YejB